MKAALYARCSTKKQDLDSQIKALKEWADKEKHTYTLYQDLAISGKKNDREGITKLMEAAKKKEFDVVGVVELSRIGRSIGFIHNTTEELSKLGIKVVLTKNNTKLDYTTLEGRALIGGLALAADIEWMLIQERNARGREKIKEEGIKVGRKRLSEKKVISIEAIRLMHENGRSLRQIAKELGVSAPTIMRYIKRYRIGHLCNVTKSNQQNNTMEKSN